MFPRGAPGIALLVLRGCIGAALAGIAIPSGWPHIAFLALISMLGVGLLTPAVCVLAVIVVLLDLPYIRDFSWVELGIILLSTSSFAFLGPGAYSIDARLFGRRMLVSINSTQARGRQGQGRFLSRNLLK